MERIASGLNMSVLELLGFEVAEARRAFKKSVVDYEELVSAITKNKRADRSLARQTCSRNFLPGDPVDSGARAKFSSETTAAMGRPKPPHCSLGGCAVASLREPAELLGDQIDRVDPLAFALEAVLAKPATHMN